MRVATLKPCAAMLAALFALPACGQVEVMEPEAPGAGVERRSERPAPAPVAAPPAPATRPSATGELYNQVLILQEEVMKLRGIVEEQGEQIRALKQQRLDDYISLDRRIGALGGGSTPPAGTETGAPPVAGGEAPPPGAIRADETPRPPPAPSRPAASEEAAYQSAYELVRNRRFPDAIAAFNDFLAQYPSGVYAGNSHYWLGELYLLNGESDAAKRHFESLVFQFPDNRKVADGMFKLGRIYHQEGDNARAKELLQRVVDEHQGSDSAAPRLAREYLQQNF